MQRADDDGESDQRAASRDGVSSSDLFWIEDPLPVSGAAMGNYDSWKSTEPDPSPRCNANVPERINVAGRCEQCWRDAYGSFPGHVLCRGHFMEFQAKAIAALVASAQRRAS